MLMLFGDIDEQAGAKAREVKSYLVLLEAPPGMIRQADAFIAGYDAPPAQRNVKAEYASPTFQLDWLEFVLSEGDEARTYDEIADVLTSVAYHFALKKPNEALSEESIKALKELNDRLDEARKKCRQRRECAAALYDPLVELRLLTDQPETRLDDLTPAIQKINKQLVVN